MTDKILWRLIFIFLGLAILSYCVAGFAKIMQLVTQ